MLISIKISFNFQSGITLSISMSEIWSYHHSNALIEGFQMSSWWAISNHWMLRSIKISLNIQFGISPSILMLQTWNTHHSNPLDETILMTPISLNSIKFQSLDAEIITNSFFFDFLLYKLSTCMLTKFRITKVRLARMPTSLYRELTVH